ncbi:MAG: ABC transporter permease [Candidatus Adiutrix sp.]|jgi:phospholipid/cholesterol/gamma-HCH transport system permease protein|nr:ABC transporter permease [Candidatus Adiutrix sp.]
MAAQSSIILTPVARLGALTLGALYHLGNYSLLLFRALASAFGPPWRLRGILRQMEAVGVESIFVVILTGLFTGGVFTLQVIYGFRLFAAESLVGPTVALAMCRELGPVLTALMVTGRVGSAMAAELGAMRVTEQIDALTVMAADPIKFLISPRIIAGLTMLPFLAAVADFTGILGGYAVAVAKGVDPGQFVGRIRDHVVLADVVNGLTKSGVFGLILTSVGCYMGYYSQGGAEGVGRAATGAVVISYVAILASDFLMTAVMF